MLNKAIIIGRLGRDPEIRHTQSGDEIANFSIATSEKWTNKNGEKKEQTEWHRVVMFGKLAEIAGKYLKKGSLVYIEGRLQTRKWENSDGEEKYTTEIVCSGFNATMKMLDSKNGKPKSDDPPHDPKTGEVNDEADLDDDIPL